MKAAVYRQNGEPETLSYEEVPDPVAAAGQVLIRVEVISIEGADLLTRRLVRPRETPFVVGYVAAGEIVGIGEGVTGLSVGQRVTSYAGSGSHAELRTARAAHVWILPDRMATDAAATAQIPFGTAWQALFGLGRLEAGETVLVHGAAGGVGLATVQLAHRAGARVIGTGSSQAALAALRTYGLNETIVADAVPIAEHVRALTGGRGADLLIDPVGGAALQQGVEALRDGGRAVMVGAVDRSPQVVDVPRLMRQRKALIGCMLGPITHQPEIRASITTLLQRIAEGELVSVIDRSFPLAEASAAHRRAEQRGRIGRVVMTP